MGFIKCVDRHEVKSRNHGEPTQISKIWDIGKPAPKNDKGLKNHRAVNGTNNIGSVHEDYSGVFLFNQIVH